jgi:hypothetical protein
MEICYGYRIQGAAKRAAFIGKRFSLQRGQEEKQINAAWREHTRIVRGNPIRVYEGEKFLLKRMGYSRKQ